jgi:hypothetical protein
MAKTISFRPTRNIECEMRILFRNGEESFVTKEIGETIVSFTQNYPNIKFVNYIDDNNETILLINVDEILYMSRMK